MKILHKLVLILVGIMLISFGTAALLGIFLPGGGLVSAAIDAEEYYTLADLNGIFVETVSTNVNFIPIEDDGDIRIHLHGTATGSTNSIPELETSRTGESLRITVKNKPFTLNIISFKNLKMDIYIPESYSGEIMVSTVSGNVAIKGLDLQKFRFKAVSGDLSAELFAAAEAVFDTTSSGGIQVRDFAGDARVEVVSGNVLLDYREFAHDINIKSTSGNVRLVFPANAEFKLSLRTVSGKINSEFPISLEGDRRNMHGTVGSDRNSIGINTVSGNVKIINR